MMLIEHKHSTAFVVVRSEIIEWCSSKEEAMKVKQKLDEINMDDCVYTIDEIPATTDYKI